MTETENMFWFYLYSITTHYAKCLHENQYNKITIIANCTWTMYITNWCLSCPLQIIMQLKTRPYTLWKRHTKRPDLMNCFLWIYSFMYFFPMMHPQFYSKISWKKKYLVATTFQYIFIYENDEIHIIYYNVVLVISVYIFYSNTDPHLKSLCIWKWFSLLYRYLLLCLNTLVVNKLYIKW